MVLKNINVRIDFSDKDDKIASDESDSKRTSITGSDPRECGSKRAEGAILSVLDFIKYETRTQVLPIPQLKSAPNWGASFYWELAILDGGYRR